MDLGPPTSKGYNRTGPNSGKKRPRFPAARKGTYTHSAPAQAEPCERCGQPTRNFWLAEDGDFSPWCAFCVTTQVAGAVGSSRFVMFLDTFARSIDSGPPEGVRSASLALRALAALAHDRPHEPGPPPDEPPRKV